MKRKKFTTHAPTEPAMFDLENPKGEEKCFRIRFVTGMAVVDVMSAMSISASDIDEDDGRTGELLKAFMQFLHDAIVPEQWDEFEAWIRDPENYVDLAKLQEIVGFLVEVVSGKEETVPLPALSGVG